MPQLIFDIETAALSKDSFDETQQEYLFRSAEALPDQVSRQTKRAEIERQFSLWPFTSQIACIAMLNVESLRGQVLFVAEDHEEEADEHQRVQFVPCVDEPDLISRFWDVARHYDQVVTFNGRSFDVPYLYLRSAALNVPITRKDWLGYRFQTEPHCDLAEQLTFYGVSGREGAARRFNLDFYCRVFGIESPKSQGVTGMDVTRLAQEGEFRRIAEYCVRDVQATAQLYHLWKERLAGIK